MILCSQDEYLEYRSVQNPLYWKNRKPHPDYWQQDVHYTIKAELDDNTDIITGDLELIYWNNSPFVIHHVYFNLYNNAQCEGSYLSDLYRNNGYRLKFSKYRSQGLGTQVLEINAEGKSLITETDNTVMKVALPKPLEPGENITFKIKFKTYFDAEAMRNRMKMFKSFGKKHYDIVHWYPRISVFDRKFGWVTDQHMDHEFYGDFGSYHVEFTLPEEYIIDGTGVLMNEKEVLPEVLRKKLDLSNFLKKEFNSPPSEIIPKTGNKKTWIFSAINVHDAAYTADPNYRIGEKNWNGVRCIALVQEPHAAGWHNAPDYIAKVLEVNSSIIGPYYYPKMICADAQDGMEYPMLTLDGGFDPDYRGLLIHEMTHNWFFGMLGSNETYRAFLDEGFTQFFTAETYQLIEGPFVVYAEPIKKNLAQKYYYNMTKPVRVWDDEAYNAYYQSNVVRDEKVTLNTHSDDFNGAIRHGGGYGQVYSKTAVMLKNLEYVLGKPLFDKVIKDYFERWKFCHPYPEDFRESVFLSTGIDLNWFFDQWIETTKTIDYKISGIKNLGEDKYAVKFKRIGEMQMPIDFAVIDKNDSAHWFHIPNTWYAKKGNFTVLPRWIGWGPKLKTTYQATVTIPGGVKNVIIDPTRRLADVYMPDNMLKKNFEVKFNSEIYQIPDWKIYQFKVRPSVWYNGFDGIKPGIYLHGDYLKTHHIIDFYSWISTAIGQYGIKEEEGRNNYQVLSLMLNYKTRLNFLKKTNFYFQGRYMEQMGLGLAGMERFNESRSWRFYTHAKVMHHKNPKYLIHSKEWAKDSVANAVNGAWHAGADYQYYYYFGSGKINMNFRAPIFTNNYDFSSFQLSAVNKNRFWKFDWNTRFFAQLGWGSRAPSESMLYVYGANNEDIIEDKFIRAYGIVPRTWGGFGEVTGHFHYGGGLNLRGYSGYLLPVDLPDGTQAFEYKGFSGTSINMELEFGRLLSFLAIKKWQRYVALQPYLFADAGIISITPFDAWKSRWSFPMVDAGAGVALNIKRWGVLSNLNPLVIRADFPFFINRLPKKEKDYVQLRWVIGVERAF
ncbi:MAG: M1 family metallopeptidase [Bacteroidia bacterium]|nr:M1 family metallopeptidase [Bacteroidia bacterium]